MSWCRSSTTRKHPIPCGATEVHYDDWDELYYDDIYRGACQRPKCHLISDTYSRLGVPVVRYERLRNDPARKLLRLLKRWRLGATAEAIDLAVKKNDIAELSKTGQKLNIQVPPSHSERGVPTVAKKTYRRGRSYIWRCGPQTAIAQIGACKYKIDVNDLKQMAGRSLGLNEIGLCEFSLNRKVAFEPYSMSRENGGFILIDRLTNDTVGAGMIDFALRRSSNIHWQAVDVDKAARVHIKSHQPCCLWFTGLSGAGKSTIANSLERRLHAIGVHTYLLDGDNVRHGLCRDLGFTEADRVENIRRISEVARLMTDAGLITLVSLISPFEADRQSARELFTAGEFIEVLVDTPLAVCEARDPKGLYGKARRGQIRNLTVQRS